MNVLKGLLSSGAGSVGVGIDITPEQILITQLTKRGPRNLTLSNLTWAPTPTGAVIDGRVENPAAVARVIQELMEARRIKPGTAATAIPSREAVTRLIRLPAELQAAELREVVLNQEAELYLPFPRDEAYVDYQSLETSQDNDGIRRQEVLLVAAPRDIVDSYLTTIQQAGLTTRVVDVASFSIIRVLRNKLLQYAPEEAVALLVIQADGTEISILIKGVPQFSRTVPIGTWEFREALCRALDLPPGQATSLLQSLTPPLSGTSGVEVEDQSFSGRGLAALRRILTELAEEIQRSLDFYLSQGDVAPIAQILLAGTGATMNQLDQYLSQRLSLPVERIDPLQILSLTEDEVIPADIRSGVGTALGLSLRTLG
ncbi:type IV pilus assembly protein PilM [Candidatus Cyanaurora vandensis]|uniref:type IV pilus assembly protein PilM n=1 Tax=Candidatus Cyanaurora vandensis TaxID=2714958 RepID=UPI00257A9009|nr:type IV pilus assembly protein PilM [Candidatus Cyanaurora vandensis]